MPRTKAYVRIRDRNRIPKLLEELDYLNSHVVEIGVFGEEDSAELMIAGVHEYGVRITVTPKMRAYLHRIGLHLKDSTTHITIPERSYLRSTFDEEEQKLTEMAQKGIRAVMMGRVTGQRLLEQIGAWLVSQVQNKITELKEPPLHPFTIKRKGSSNPLIDTGRLRQSITYRVVAAK